MWPFKSAEEKAAEEANAAAHRARHKEVIARMNAFAPPGTKFNYRGVEMMSLGVWGGGFSEEVIVAEFKTLDGRFEKKQFGIDSLEILQAEQRDYQC